MAGEQGQYLAYLVRLWQVTNAGERVWRVALQDVHTGERLGFASLEHLVAFLEAQTGGNSKPEADLGAPTG